jgi:hypothetical protein
MPESRIKRRGRKGSHEGRKENPPPPSSAPTFASSALKDLLRTPRCWELALRRHGVKPRTTGNFLPSLAQPGAGGVRRRTYLRSSSRSLGSTNSNSFSFPLASQRKPSVPARAHNEHLLHMRQSFAPGYSGWNVRSCRLASRSTSTRRHHTWYAPGIRGAESGPAATARSSPSSGGKMSRA